MGLKRPTAKTVVARLRGVWHDQAVKAPEDPLFGIRTETVRFDEAVYFVPGYAAHRPVSRSIMDQRYASPRLHKLVKNVMARRPGSMVHAGTFFGDMLPSFSRKTPGTVYAFEPVIENYLLARAVVHENDLDNVVLLHAGLGTEMGLGWIETMRRHRHRGGTSSIVRDPAKRLLRAQRTPILSIDQMGIEDLSLIQLDVEGFELPILQGAVETIRAQRPVIVIEDDRKNCSDLLRELGYSAAARVGRDHLFVVEPDATRLADVIERLSPPCEGVEGAG
jgi:FkbM family methyltransferase